MSVDIATLAIRIDSLEARNAARDLERLRESGNRAERSTNSLTSSTRGLQSAMAVLGITVGAATLMKFTTDLYAAAAAAENLRLTFQFSFAETAGKELNYVKDLANDLGLELMSTAREYGKLSAAARGTTLEGDGARAIFESISRASAVMGLSAEQAGGALNAIQQMISKGTVASEELRGQLGERLPGAFQIASRAMGITTQELGKMLEQGQVIADDFLPKFAAQLNSEIGGASEDAADRLDAATNRMMNSLKRLMTVIAESGIAEFFKDMLKWGANDISAVAEAMERAKSNGAGGLGQVNAGAGMFIGKALGLNLFTDEAKTLDQQLASTIKRIADLQKHIEGTGKASIYTRSDMASLQKTLASLTAEQQRRDSVNAVNPQDVRLKFMGKEREAQIKAEQQATAELAALRQKLSGVDASYLPTLTKLQSMRASGILGEKEYISLVSDLASKNYKKTDSSRSAAASIQKEATAYQSLISSIHEKIAAGNLEMIGYDQLTESQKLTIKLDSDIAAGKIKSIGGHVETARALIAERAAQELVIEENKYYIEQAKEKYDASSAAVKAATDEADAVELLARTFGMAKSAIEGLELARINQKLAQADNTEGYTEEIARLEALRAAQERIMNASRIVEGKELGAKNDADVSDIAIGLLSPSDRDDMAHADRMNKLAINHAAIYGSAVEANLLMEAEVERHEQHKADIRAASNIKAVSMAGDAAGQLYNIMKQAGKDQSVLGKTLFLATKALAVAEIILNTERGAAAALGMGPFGIPISTYIRATGYASAGMVAGLAIAEVSAEGGYDIPAGVNPLVQAHQKEMILPKAQADVIRGMATRSDGGSSSGDFKLTLVTNGTPQKVSGSQVMSDGERILIIEDATKAAVRTVSAQMSDDNSRIGQSMKRNYNVQRSR